MAKQTEKEVPFPAQVIKVVDPKVNLSTKARAGSLRNKRWAILMQMNGKTVSDYYAACRKAEMPCTANNPRDAVEKGLITLSAPKS
jgi:hypothetical protein